jgi:hypothetical protein
MPGRALKDFFRPAVCSSATVPLLSIGARFSLPLGGFANLITGARWTARPNAGSAVLADRLRSIFAHRARCGYCFRMARNVRTVSRRFRTLRPLIEGRLTGRFPLLTSIGSIGWAQPWRNQLS